MSFLALSGRDFAKYAIILLMVVLHMVCIEISQHTGRGNSKTGNAAGPPPPPLGYMLSMELFIVLTAAYAGTKSATLSAWTAATLACVGGLFAIHQYAFDISEIRDSEAWVFWINFHHNLYFGLGLAFLITLLWWAFVNAAFALCDPKSKP